MPVETNSNPDLQGNKIERTILLSVYIDFNQETKRKLGWELFPNQELWGNNRPANFDYYEIRKFAETNLVTTLKEQLRYITRNDTIKVIIEDTRFGSIELLLVIYGAYASIADFIETTKIIREFINRHYNIGLSNRFGSFFYVNTTVHNQQHQQPIRKNIDNVMILLTILVSVFTIVVLFNFSFGFINDVVVNSVFVAFFLAIVIEVTKILTSFFIVQLKENNKTDNKNWLLVVRIIAIILSSLFCLSEITNKNTAPNLAQYREEKQVEYKIQFDSDSTDIVKSYDKAIEQKISENNNIVIGANIARRYNTIDYTPLIAEKRRIDNDIEKLRNEKGDELKKRKEKKQEDIYNLMKPDYMPAETNNEKINSILQTIFNIKPDSEGYQRSYQRFVIWSSLLITLLIEIISIVSVQNISYYFLRR